MFSALFHTLSTAECWLFFFYIRKAAYKPYLVRALMAISPTTKKVIIDGERAPSYPVQFGDSSSSFSGIISGIAGTLVSMSMKVDEI